jgi:hypothetical protein
MNKIDENFRKLLTLEGLDEQDVFYADYATFEEIPLFSRWMRINFLKKYDFDKRNELLLQFATKFVEKLLSNAPYILGDNGSSEYFSCVSITNWDCISEIGCISPNFYISKKKTWLLSNLGLETANFPEIKMIENYLSNLQINKKKVCISKGYDPENKRIYIVDDFLLE